MLQGELAALATAVCWTMTALNFEAAGKRVGSLPVNIIRLAQAFVFISLYTFFVYGRLLETDIPAAGLNWLLLSGFVGFFLGDLFLFQAFVEIGSRIAMLVMSFAPPLTALLGWVFLDQTMTGWDFVGMVLVVAGIALVVLKGGGSGKVAFRHPVRGLLFAFGGALGQAGGLILSKLGLGELDPFVATQVRAVGGLAGFALIAFAGRQWRKVGAAFRDRRAMGRITLGALFGPFLGVSLSLLALRTASAGVVSTLIAIVPVLIIVPSVVIYKEKVTPREVLGALVAVAGVAVIFLT